MRILRSIRTIDPILFSVFFLFLLLSLLPGRQLKAEMVDRVVAVVNNEIITLSELDKEGEGTFRKIAATTPSANLATQLAQARAEILDTLIDKKLIAQKAAAQKISVSDAEVDTAFENVLQRSHLTREQLLVKLNEAGADEEVYRTTLRSQLLQNKLVGADVTSKVVVTDDMILDYYDANYISHVKEDGYYLLQIGCSWHDSENTDASKAAQYENKLDAKNRVEKVHKLAKAGEDFAELARKFSDLPSREDGGDIGTFKLEDMASDMRDAVSGLKSGEVSDIIETNSGFQFFKLLSSGDDTIVKKASYEDVKDSIKQELYEKEIQKAYAEWVKKLKDQAYIQKL